ncbi:synaptotagmin-7-like [Brevipalpus obovatus]|uniref:synaptotagmin-7-like n=1 Tax=Brevipalpus obovatus TaxID=246614 RepID=UPI003D9E7482
MSDFVLTDHERLFIIICASALFLLSVIITCCIVSPICFLNRYIFRSKNSYPKSVSESGKQRLVLGESKHFSLKVVSLYGANISNNNNNGCLSDKSSPTSNGLLDCGGKMNCLKSKENGDIGDQCAKHAYEKVKHTHHNDHHHFMGPFNGQAKKVPGNCETIQSQPSIWLSVRCEKTPDEGDNQYRMIIKVHKITDLRPREYGVEPACYVIIDLAKISNTLRTRKHKSCPGKIITSYRTDSARRSLNPEYKDTFITGSYSRSLLKESYLKLKIMDDERYANDFCLGELSLPVKQFIHEADDISTTSSSCSNGTQNNNIPSICHEMKPTKEFKGMLHLTICYLPTAKRCTINISKASLISSSQATNYYVRVLMFVGGKLIKKKKTTPNSKLQWIENDGINFDLESGYMENIAFLFVLSSTNDSNQTILSSPSSPESPEMPSGSRKDRHIGHAVVGAETWNELKHHPRKPIVKSLRLM